MDWSTFKPEAPQDFSTFNEWDKFVPEKPAAPVGIVANAGRGVKEAFQQLPQLGYGLMAGAGATAETAFGEGGIATGIKKAGVKGYQAYEDKMQKDALPSDSFTYSYDKAKEGDFGAMVDWLTHGIGYAGGQAAQMLATAGLGSVIGKAGLKATVEKLASGMVSKEAAALAATEEGAKLSADQLAKAATANVAGRIGAATATGASAYGMEGGEIGGGIAKKSVDENRALTGEEIAKALGATFLAGTAEFGERMLGLEALKGKLAISKKLGEMPGIKGKLTRAGTSSLVAAPIEGLTEYGQTGIEEYGKGNEANMLPWNQSEANQGNALDAAAQGMLGGVLHSSAGGILSSPQKAPITHIADIGKAATVDDAIKAADNSVLSAQAVTNFIDAVKAGTPIRDQQSAQAYGGEAGLLSAYPDIATLPKVGTEKAYELNDLVTREGRDLETLRAELQREFSNDRDLNDLQAQGRALEAAKIAEAPTAMQLAMQKATTKPNIEGTTDVITSAKTIAPAAEQSTSERGTERQVNSEQPTAEPVAESQAPAVSGDAPAQAGSGPIEYWDSLDASARTDAIRRAGMATKGGDITVRKLLEKKWATIPISTRAKITQSLAEIQAEREAHDQEHLGVDSAPLREGGKPFKSKKSADSAKKQQPMLRVVKVAGGFALAPKTEKQLAAQEKAARRLGLATTGQAGTPIAAHEFIAGEGMLSPSTRADMGMEGNVRIGNRSLFAGAGRGMTIEQATERLIESGYLNEGDSHEEARNLIKQSLNSPRYTPQDTELMAGREADQRFADYLAAEQDAAQSEDYDPFASMAGEGIIEADLQGTGFAEANPEIQQEVAALSSQLDALGIDSESVRMEVAEHNESVSNQEYYELAKHAIQTAIAEQESIAAGRGNSGADMGQQSQAGNIHTDEAHGLVSPTRADILAQQERADNEEKAKIKADVDAEKKAKAERDAVEIKARQYASAENFALGQNAEDSLSGQGGIFAESNQGNAKQAPSKNAIYKLDNGTYAKFEDGVWFRGEESPQKAMKTEMVSANLKPKDRGDDQNWVLHSDYSIDAYGAADKLKKAKSNKAPAAQATEILDAANVTGKERIDVLKDVKSGDITPDELKAAYPAKEEKPITPDQAANLTRGAIVIDSNGVEYYAWSARFDRLDVMPMKDGKPVVHAGSAIRFALTDTARDANPEYRDDPLYLVSKEKPSRIEDSGQVANETERDYTDNYTTDLFGNELPAPTGKTKPSRSNRAGLRGDVQPTAALSDTDLPNATFYVNTIMGKTADRQLGASLVQTHEQAAQATRYLYQSAVERFDGIVTDKNGKPLAVIGGFKGALSQASIYPATLMGEAVRIPGAAHVWFSHNHPSGNPSLSRADMLLNQSLSDVFRGSGIEPMGIMAVAGDKYSYVDERGHGDATLHRPIPSAKQGATVPVVERQLGKGAPAYEINSPLDAKIAAKSLYNKNNGPGILLLNAHHAIAGWMPITQGMHGPLRSTGELNAIYRAISQSNAGAAIIVHGGELSTPTSMAGVTASQNIAAALKKVDVNPLDSINVKTGVAEAEQGMKIADGPMFSRESVQREQNALKALSENDDIFALPKSDKTTVQGIAADTDPSITVKAVAYPGLVKNYVLTMPNGAKARLMVRSVNPYGPQAYGISQNEEGDMQVTTDRPGDNAESIPDDMEDVYIDVSTLKEGGYGAKVYNIAATFAHNTGRILIGDPAGLSNSAMRRRTENMLSSALKFGTTRHLAPHPRQLEGASSIGVPPLHWTYGDDLANIESLIQVSMESLDHAGANLLTFDLSTGTFRDSEGGVFDDDAIRQIVEVGRRPESGAGIATYKRNAVLSALVREESEKSSDGRPGSGILAKLVDVGRQFPASSKGIFYAKTESGVRVKSVPRGLSQTQFNQALTKAFGAKVADKLIAKGVVVPLANQSNLPNHIVPFLRDNDVVYGFYDPKTDKTYAVLSNLTEDMVKGLVLHEVGVHYGFERMLGKKSYDSVIKRLDVMRRAGNKAVQAAFDEAEKNSVRPSQIPEENLAYLVQNHPEMTLVKQLISKIKAFLFNEFGIGGKYLNNDDITMLAYAAISHSSKTMNGGFVPSFMKQGKSTDDSTPGAAFDAQAAFEKHGGEGDIDESTEITAKSLAFADMAEAEGYKVSGRGDKYVTITKSFGKTADGYEKDVIINVRISDHSNVNRGHHFGETDINLAPDDGYSRDTFSDALKKIKSAYVNDDLDTVIPNEPTAPDSGSTNPDIYFSRSSIVGQTSRKHTPEQLKAMKNVGFDVTQPTLKERAKLLWKDAGKKMAQGIVDQFAPVKDLDKKAYGLMRLAKGASGAFEAFLQGGKLKLTDGVYDFDQANKGGVVDKLLIPLQGEHHDFMRWVAANRAERLMGDGKENLFTKEDIAALKTLSEGTTDFGYTIQTGPKAGQVTRDRSLIYGDALRVFNGFNKNILDMAEQSGLIDPESRKYWEHEFYVPFYRVADEGGVRGMNIKGSVVRQEAFKSLKGGKGALNADLLDNTLMNWAHLLDAAAKNRAAKATIEAAEAVGAAMGGNQSTLAEMASSVHNKQGVVWFMDGGQKRYSLIDQEDGPYLLTALTSLEYAGMRNPVMNAMSSMKHALTIGVTASPFFKVRNLIRDSVQAIGTGNLSYNPAKNIAEGWKLTDPKSDAYFRLLAGGGTIHFGTMMEGSEAKRIQALVESGVDASTILNNDHKVKAFYRKFIEPGVTAYNELGNRGEAINRASLYDQLVKQGMNHAEASLQARDLMDFSMQGSFATIRFLTQVVPFFNARLQGLYKLGKSAKEDPKRFGIVLGATAVLSIGLLAAYGDDDDWKKREESDRNNFWWFKFGGTAFRIPKPFEIGAIATLAERGFELAFDKEMTNKRFLNQVLTLLGDNLSMNPVPQLIKPIVDIYANKDSFTGRPIETMGQENLRPEYRFNDRTSMVARGLSTSLNAATGIVGKESLSPVQIDHMLRGYFGWLGSFVVGASDIVARPATGQAEHASADMWKVATGNMVSDLRDAPSRYVTQMYTQAKEIEQSYGTYRDLVKQGKFQEATEFKESHNDDLIKYKHVEQVKRAEAKLNERIRYIERSNIEPDAKRDLIRTIQMQKNKVAESLSKLAA